MKLLRSARALSQLARCALHLLHGMWTIWRHFQHASALQKSEHVTQWARSFLAILNVKTTVTGVPQVAGPLMLVSNHVSWLDILVLLAVQPLRFVSKSDIQRWPVIGWLATHAGTLYIERSSRRDALRTVHQIADALKSGDMIAFFPEGTTSDGSGLLPFHANLLQAAIAVNAPVQAVTMRFQDAATGQRSRVAAYIDDDHLLGSVWGLLHAAPLEIKLQFASPEHAGARDRRAWAQDLHQKMLETLQNK